MIFEERVPVPLGITGLADFRRWSGSLGCGYRLESRGNAPGGRGFDLVEEGCASSS